MLTKKTLSEKTPKGGVSSVDASELDVDSKDLLEYTQSEYISAYKSINTFDFYKPFRQFCRICFVFQMRIT